MHLASVPISIESDDRRRWAALIVVCLAQLMIVLDVTIVNVALPSIQQDLGFSQANLTWVVNAFLVTFGSLLLTLLALYVLLVEVFGFSVELTHHVMHAMGSRLLGFTQELFDDSRSLDPEVRDMLIREMGKQFPHIVEIVKVVYHEADSVVGPGCDDQAEFEFALDLLLDGLEALLQREIQSPAPSPVRGPIHG